VQVDQAIDWLVKLRFDTPARFEQQFQQWLASHPQPPGLAAGQSSGRRAGRAAQDLSRRTLDASQHPKASRRDHLKLLGLLAVGGSLGWAAREPLGLPQLLADTSTATGERRQWQGTDGSRIQLNTASAIDLHFSADQRQLD
jgi:transmembrane sensor